MPPESVQEKIVVIVGGGFAGLSAAYKLSLVAPDMTYVVLEAGAELGGRTVTRDCSKDFGAGYVGQLQNHIQFLIRSLGIETVPTFLDPRRRWIFHDPSGAVVPFPGDNPLAFPGVPNALFRLGELDLLALELRRNLREPWTLPNAAILDAITAQDWIDEQRARYDAANPQLGMSEETATIFTASVRAAFSLEPREISFFYLLYYAACAGSYSALVDIAGGEGTAEGTRFRYGTQDAINKLADAVGRDNIVTGARVQRIECDATGARVYTDGHGVWRATKVIVALSPAVSESITYTGLPPEYAARQALCMHMQGRIGRTIKGFVRFATPRWREMAAPACPTCPATPGAMGYMLSMADFRTFPIGWTLDNVYEGDPTGVDGCRDTRYELMTFIGGEAADYWSRQPPEERARAVIAHLRTVYGFADSDFYTSPPESSYEERNWPGDFSGVPAPAAIMPPGVLGNPTLASALRRPLGQVHWAGSETAIEWNGYMNGAVESGFRTASEVLEALA
ncbi:MAG TPA: NAD(P)/FAD-dependent oxidoreductase [Polyangiaceae bacterium]|nr:NAD(P)/FAD-dependent oxidoreductase [Polyangiaceae bacterium]